MSTTQTAIDTFICVHHRDLGPIFEATLRSYRHHFGPKGQLFLITNDLPQLRDFLDRADLAAGVVLSRDEEWLSPREQSLPGWYRQQIIKLRADQFCTTAHCCSLGADTLLLKTITADDFLDGERSVLYYYLPRKRADYLLNLRFLRYERDRVKHVARLLGVEPTRARRYGDFIFDLFCFRRDSLRDLYRYLERRHGDEPYYRLLRDLPMGKPDTNPFGGWTQNRFGEWTLYSVFLLDCLRADVVMRNGADGFLRQIHSARQLRHSRFDTKVVHLVDKEFSLAAVRDRIAAQDAALAGTLLGHHAPLLAN